MIIEKIAGMIVDSKLKAQSIQDKVGMIYGKMEGWKTHILAFSSALAAFLALLNQTQELIRDGLQFNDLVVLYNSQSFYFFLLSLAAMTGRSALTKLAAKLPGKPGDEAR